MKIERFFKLAFGAIGVVAAVGAKPCLAQLPPGLPVPAQNYATLHFWGPAGTVGPDHLALASACVADDTADWHANPAAVLAVRRPTVSSFLLAAGFQKLPTVHSSFLGYAQNLGSSNRFAFKVAYIPIRADGAVTGTPLVARLRENDPELELAFRATPQLSLGLGLSYLDTSQDYTLPGVGVVTHLDSVPSRLGGRLGAIFRPSKRLAVGATLDTYSERVEQTVPALGTPVVVSHFATRAYRVGLNWTPDRRTKLLADYQSARLSGGGTVLTSRPLMVGVERKVRYLALRGGSYNGKLSGGLGMAHRGWAVDYAFTKRYSVDLPGQGGRTAHALQVNRSF